MINISQKFDSNQTQKCRFIDVNIQILEVYTNLHVQSSCKLLFVQGSWWLFAPSCLDAQAGKPQGSKMLAIKNEHSLLPSTGNVHVQIPLSQSACQTWWIHFEGTNLKSPQPSGYLNYDHSPTPQSLLWRFPLMWQVANFMWVKQCHVYHPWLGMVYVYHLCIYGDDSGGW